MGGELQGKVAPVAGASRGIGKGIAVELGAAGAHVWVCGRTLGPGPPAPDRWPSRLTERDGQRDRIAGGSATPFRCDFTDDGDVAACSMP